MNRIALVMIVRDEARSLARCLVSACPWVDEMIVLDTGSVDATPEIARRIGARVERFDWCDDFAAARNAALALTDDAVSLDELAAAPPERLAIVLGTEGDGLSHGALEGADVVVTIPMARGVDSLNVAAASAVALWALRV